MVVAVTGLAACDSDDAVGPGDDGGAAGEFVLEGQVADFDHGDSAQIAPNVNPSLGEGTIDPDGSFTVTLFGEDDIGGELEPVDPESISDGVRAFPCDEEVYDIVGSDIEFAAVPTLLYGAGGFDNLIGLADEEVDPTTPMPLEEGTHVRWIFTEEAVTLDVECRDGNRVMDLDLAAGWNEVIIEVSRPGNAWLYDQYTGERPSDVEWMLN